MTDTTALGPDALLERARALHRELRTPENSLAIRRHLQAALAVDPGSDLRRRAEALGLLAETLMCDYLNSWNDAGAAELAEAEAAVERALAIIADLAIAHYASGLVHRAKGQHDAALAAFSRTVELNPEFALAHAQKGAELIYTGRPQEALTSIEAAIRVSRADSPARPMFFWYMGRAHFFAGNYREAIPWLQRSVEGRGNIWYNRAYLTSALALVGEREAAAAALHAFDAAFPGFTLARVVETEQTNPNDNPLVVAARHKFHEGLLGAGLRPQ
jgi:adenylate cyclase